MVPFPVITKFAQETVDLMLSNICLCYVAYCVEGLADLIVFVPIVKLRGFNIILY